MRSDSFLSLVKLGIGHKATHLNEKIDWLYIQTLAYQHGLSGIVLDGVDKLPEDKRPPKDIALTWIGEVLHIYEYRYESYRRSISEMAGFYKEHAIKMMILKGYACSLNWPKPEHRPCGDIDIWLFGKQKEADSFISKEKRIKVDNSHHHHTVFNWGEFTVENHYDFINVYHNKHNRELEMIFKELGKDDTHYVEVLGENIYVPAPNLHALFLLRHMISDFVSTVVTLRQILDWAFFVSANHKDIDWAWLLNTLDRFGMLKIFMIINAICIEDLGFESTLFPSIQYDHSMKDKVFCEIVSPKYTAQLPTNVTERVLYKFSRWRASGWKHELCFNESMLSSFLSGVRSHLIKPSTI